ncbi:hypothetical protein [Kitasatospora sp. NPDC097643]|uniref:hypothetical protein n=1 Tax=Kitasatospora sp. NPDC097643 TaxID=3157230 RepID=UPI003330F08B
MAEIQRQVLPIPDIPRPGPITYDAKDPDTSFPPIRPLRPPERAPNVLIVMLDDVGYDRYIQPGERIRIAMARQ